MKRTSPAARGFTLIEILVVLAIISIIVAFTVPALEPALRGSRLKNASDALERAMSNAQQSAITDNRAVEFRLFLFDDPETAGSDEYYSSFQAVEVIRDPSNHLDILEEKPITEVETLPPPFVIADSSWSTLVQSDALIKGSTDIPRRDQVEYVAFEFRPDGSTNLANVDEKHWTLTIVKEPDANSSGELPKEFITLLLDPYNGRVRAIQP